MATAAAGDCIFRGAFEGCISGHDSEISRRPYHRNCSCALHKSKRKRLCNNVSTTKISYPIRRSWSEGSLVLTMDSANSSPSNSNSPSSSSSPVATHNLIRRSSMNLIIDDGEVE